MSDDRPDPDALLRRLEAAQAPSRGRLKVFFGASPGVGKTYAMLEAARARKKEGRDVLIGWVETHGRAETAALVEGLERLPARPLEYRGVSLDGVRHRRGAGPQARHPPARRAGPHQRARRAPRQAVAGRGGAAGRGDPRLHHPERPAPREPERPREPRHRGGRPRDRSRPRAGRRRRGGVRRSASRGPAAAPRGRQGLPAGAGGPGGAQLLPPRQPPGPARAGPAAHRRARGRRRAGLSGATTRSSRPGRWRSASWSACVPTPRAIAWCGRPGAWPPG